MEDFGAAYAVLLHRAELRQQLAVDDQPHRQVRHSGISRVLRDSLAQALRACAARLDTRDIALADFGSQPQEVSL